MKNKILLSVLLLFLVTAFSHSQDTVSSKDAKNFIGQTKIITGKVASVFVSKNGTVLINFDEKHPNATFVAVIKPENPVAYDNIKEGSILTVTGVIEDYKGKPEVIIKDISQILGVE